MFFNSLHGLPKKYFLFFIYMVKARYFSQMCSGVMRRGVRGDTSHLILLYDMITVKCLAKHAGAATVPFTLKGDD